MKTLRISDDIHRKMTATLGTLMALNGEPCTQVGDGPQVREKSLKRVKS